MYRIALFGLPTAGKSSLSYLVSEKYSVPQINIGQILRTGTVYNHTEIKEISSDQGISDKVICSIIYNELEKVKEKGYILDGFPRNLKQLAFFETLPFSERCQYIFLYIDPLKVRSRYLRRMNCPNCRRADYSQSMVESRQCKRCGGELIKRIDTMPEALVQKLKNFKEFEVPMIKHLTYEGRLLQLNVEGNPDHDFLSLMALLNRVLYT